MHLFRTGFNGSPNVGLHGFSTDTYVLLGEHLAEPVLAKVTEALGSVPVHQARIAGTALPGVFLAGNSRAVLVPGIAFDTEVAHLKALGVPVTVFPTRHTCLGNNILCNDRGAIVSPDFTEGEQKEIARLLGVPVLAMGIAGLPTPGALVVLNGEKGIIHRDATTAEKHAIERHLGVTLEAATANLGAPYLRAAMINNGHGFVIGDATGGPEIVHIDEALGYLGEDDE